MERLAAKTVKLISKCFFYTIKLKIIPLTPFKRGKPKANISNLKKGKIRKVKGNNRKVTNFVFPLQRGLGG